MLDLKKSQSQREKPFKERILFEDNFEKKNIVVQDDHSKEVNAKLEKLLNTVQKMEIDAAK